MRVSVAITSWLASMLAMAEPLPVIIGPVSYIDANIIVVADRSFALPNRYQVQTNRGTRSSIARIQPTQIVAIYATASTPLGQPVVNSIVLQGSP